MKRFTAFLFVLCAITQANAQITNEPRTHIELAAQTPDAALVRGFSPIGSLKNQLTYPVDVRAERISDLSLTNTHVYGVSLRIRAGDLSYVSYIDYEELDAMIRAMPIISQANNLITPMENFEVTFHTRGGLSISKTVRPDKTVVSMTFVNNSGTSARDEMAPYVLDEFTRLLISAKTKMDAIAATGR